MKRNPDFVAFCPRHGFDIHDGTKNECCTDGSVMPLLEANEIQSLTPNGIALFHEDFEKLQDVISKVNIEPPAKVSAWVKGMGDQITEILAESQQENAEKVAAEESGEADDVDEDEYWAGYHAAFERGFMLGYDKGYEMAMRLIKK